MPVDTRSKSPVLLPLWCVEPKVLITSAVREVKASRSPGMVQSCIWMSRSCFGISSTGKFVTCGLVLGFDIVTPEWVGDIARWLPVLSAAMNIWGGAKILKGFATLKNVVNLQFASEVRPDISKSVLSKSRLHKLYAFMEKIWGTKMCIKFESEEILIIGDYCSKSDSKEEDRGKSTVVCVAWRRRDSESDKLSTRRSKTQLPWFRNRCDKHHYHCSSFSVFWKSRCFYTCFCIVCYCSSQSLCCDVVEIVHFQQVL